MKKSAVALLLLSVVIAACSTGRNLTQRDRQDDKRERPATARLTESLALNNYGKSTQVTGNPTFDSIHFYTMAEMAFHSGDYLTAYGLFNQADLSDPKNTSIKERVLQTLWLLANREPSRYYDLIDVAERYKSENIYTASILRFLALAYFRTEQNEKGLNAYKLSLDLEPDAHAYYDYFLYLARYGNRVDHIYLEKALKKASNDPEMQYAIAQVYEYHNPLRSKEILESAARKFNNEESRKKLVDFYQKYKDWESLVEFLQSELEKGKKVSADHLQIMLEVLFYLEEYSNIMDNLVWFRDDKNVGSLEILFYSAYYIDNYELAIDLGKTIISTEDYPEEKRRIMLATVAELYALLNDYETSAEYLMKIDVVGLIAAMLLSDIREDEDASDDSEVSERTTFDPETLINHLIEKGYDPQKGKYLLALLYKETGRQEESLALIEQLNAQEIQDDDFLKNIAVFFLDYQREEEALQFLFYVEEEDYCPYVFIGQYYYFTDHDSLAVDFLLQAIETLENPSADIFLSLATIYHRSNEHEKNLVMLEKAVLHHPENASILNWLGYSLVVHTTRYDEAEELLLKAIANDPDSYHIQDSVAWLYYKMQDYEKALSYMQEIIDNGVEDSVVAYHIGMIYYKLEEITDAVYYLLWSVLLNTDDEYRDKAEEMLEEIRVSYEE